MPNDDLIKIIPKPKAPVSKSINLLWIFSFLILIALIGLFLFLKSQKADLKKDVENANKEISALQNKTETERNLIITSEKIKDFSKILSQHKLSSKFFDFLKANCHKKVKIDSLQLDSSSATTTVALAGKAASFEILSDQLLLLKASSDVKNLQVTNVFLNRENIVEFNLNFVFTGKLTEI